MIDLEKTAMHRVYKTEQLGDALVVAVQGDSAGFSIGSVHNEMVTIVGIAGNPEVKNLIIDLSGSNYYGSLILGEIVNLAQVVREKGGRVALAGTSPDMKEVLRMMRLDAMWEKYPTRDMALRAVANLPWQERVKPYVTPVAIGSGIALLVGLYLFLPRKDYTPEYYRTTSKIWDEAKSLKAVNASDSEWLSFNDRAKQKFGDTSSRLKRLASSRQPNLQYLLWVARDYGPKSLDQRLDPQKDETQLVDYYLGMVRSELEHTEPPPRPKILGGPLPDLLPGRTPPAVPPAAASAAAK
jgi:anti-anti-sigma factor